MGSSEAARTPRRSDIVALGAHRSAVPATLVAAGAVIGIASAQGGYFPTSWGLSAMLLAFATGAWLVLYGRTDAGRLDAIFLGLLALLTCWIGLSVAWSVVPAQSVLELERAVVLLAGVTAVLTLTARTHVPWLAAALVTSIAVVSTYALATRLFPDRLGRFDSIAGYRLSDPLGYWNSLGIFAVVGILLAAGFVVDAKTSWARSTAAASVVVLATTVYFTYSRGSWIALGLGLAYLLAVTPRRLRTVAALLVVALPSALGVLLASRSDALTHVDASLARATTDGHRLALALLGLALATAGLTALLKAAERRITLTRRVRLAIGAALLAAVVAAPTILIVREGGPIALTRDAWDAFRENRGRTSSDLDRRLFSFSGSGRVQLWRAARDVYVDHPVTGSGAGTFERFWQGRDDADFKVRDAHSLYVETLAELGPPGLGLLVATLLVPLGAGLAVRRQRLLPAAGAAYAAFLVHAGVDWDWELSGVTLTALLVGCLPVIAARGRGLHTLAPSARAIGCAAALVVSLGAMVVFLGNGALDRAQRAVASESYADAVEEANRARRLMPWSPWPLITRGDAQLAAGLPSAAAASYRRAIDIDVGEWRAWFGLALSTEGRVRRAALARAHRLYPRNREVEQTIAAQNETKG
jgi:hypothetical protein